MKSKSIIVNYLESDEPLLRRLGGAVVHLWDDLSAEAQEAILDHAVYIHDKTAMVQLEQSLKLFINEHKGRSP